MKTILKIALIVIAVILLLGIAQYFFGFNLADIMGGIFGGTRLSNVRINTGQELLIPKFEIVSLEIFYPNTMSVIEADRMEWWRLNIGTVFIFVEYDSYIKLGIKNPELIHVERDGNILYVDESSIIIEILDIKVDNYKYIRTFTSNPFVISRVSPDIIFQAQNEHRKELENRIMEFGQANFESARKNFMENYKNMCSAMGLEVIWRQQIQ